ncbi:MAG TPA: hypothetical protein PK830_07880 [Candidatus Atribacteria bacterium]|nr:hypothetical protein [Candidatus Atribacteria bacterium]HPT79004.1 hypothetical protein [Candidatus Atribacteria bacterium]
MVDRLKFTQIILREIKQINYLYAVDILRQLSKRHDGMPISEFFDFFKGRSRLDVWETLMSLCEFGLIAKTPENKADTLFFITPKGIDKLQMINACLRL